MRNLINEGIAKFISENKEISVVKLTRKAAKEKNREVFGQLLEYIKGIIEKEKSIERKKGRVQSHYKSISDIRREIRVLENEVENEKSNQQIEMEI